MSMVAADSILYCQESFSQNNFKGFKLVKISCSKTVNGNVICLGNNQIIANEAENLPAIEALDREGFKVSRLDLSEFRKGAGGPSCLILPLERNHR